MRMESLGTTSVPNAVLLMVALTRDNPMERS